VHTSGLGEEPLDDVHAERLRRVTKHTALTRERRRNRRWFTTLG
jgi:hypothetical protein